MVLQWVYTKVILPVLMGGTILFTSLQLRLAEPYHVVQQKLPTYTTWYGRCHLVFGGPGYVWLVEPYHMVPLESSTTPKHGIWDNIASFFLHNTDANMICRLFDDPKYMVIYLPIHQEYRYLGKQKNSLYFLSSTCEHLWPSTWHLVNFPNLAISDIFTGFVQTFCLKFIKFQSHLNFFSKYGHLFRLRIARFPVGNGDIICPSEGVDC